MALKTPGVPRAHWSSICKRWTEGGETLAAIGKDHGVSGKAIRKILDDCGVQEQAVRPPAQKPSGDMKAFSKRARSILWSQENTTERPTFDKWDNRVNALMSKDGGGLSKNQAIVRASKEFPCLERLFREYNVVDFDPNPDSHPNIKQWGDANGEKEAEKNIVFEGAELPYCDCLRWAMERAGEHFQSGCHPASAPNGIAFYLYKQAVAEPKDFMAKMGQMESKAEKDAQGTKKLRADSVRTIKEIHTYLEELEDCDVEEAQYQAGGNQEGSQEEVQGTRRSQ